MLVFYHLSVHSHTLARSPRHTRARTRSRTQTDRQTRKYHKGAPTAHDVPYKGSQSPGGSASACSTPWATRRAAANTAVESPASAATAAATANTPGRPSRKETRSRRGRRPSDTAACGSATVRATLTPKKISCLSRSLVILPRSGFAPEQEQSALPLHSRSCGVHELGEGNTRPHRLARRTPILEILFTADEGLS